MFNKCKKHFKFKLIQTQVLNLFLFKLFWKDNDTVVEEDCEYVVNIIEKEDLCFEELEKKIYQIEPLTSFDTIQNIYPSSQTNNYNYDIEF